MRARGKIKLLAIQQILVALLTLGIVIILATQGVRLEKVVISVIGVWIYFYTIIFHHGFARSGMAFTEFNRINKISRI